MSRSTVSKYGASADFISKMARRGAHYLRFWELHARRAVGMRRTRRSVKPSAGERRLRPFHAPQHTGVDLRPGRNARREAWRMQACPT